MVRSFAPACASSFTCKQRGISKDYGNLAHGYCVTSYGSQSKGVDRVFIAESSESFRAADRQQFYVSVSRFKESLTIYTDDKHELLQAVEKSSARPSATDLVRGDFRRLRPMRALRPTRLPTMQWMVQAVEKVRLWFGEPVKTTVPSESIVVTKAPKLRPTVELPAQSTRRSRGISP